jgi:NADPH:quinone reductase-like Zn-dependent oxidoreductase
MPTAITIRKVDGKPGQVYYPLDTITLSDQKPESNQVLVRISAAALNHRDLCKKIPSPKKYATFVY